MRTHHGKQFLVLIQAIIRTSVSAVGIFLVIAYLSTKDAEAQTAAQDLQAICNLNPANNSACMGGMNNNRHRQRMSEVEIYMQRYSPAYQPPYQPPQGGQGSGGGRGFIHIPSASDGCYGTVGCK